MDAMLRKESLETTQLSDRWRINTKLVFRMQYRMIYATDTYTPVNFVQ